MYERPNPVLVALRRLRNRVVLRECQYPCPSGASNLYRHYHRRHWR